MIIIISYRVLDATLNRVNLHNSEIIINYTSGSVMRKNKEPSFY